MAVCSDRDLRAVEARERKPLEVFVVAMAQVLQDGNGRRFAERLNRFRSNLLLGYAVAVAAVAFGRQSRHLVKSRT